MFKLDKLKMRQSGHAKVGRARGHYFEIVTFENSKVRLRVLRGDNAEAPCLWAGVRSTYARAVRDANMYLAYLSILDEAAPVQFWGGDFAFVAGFVHTLTWVEGTGYVCTVQGPNLVDNQDRPIDQFDQVCGLLGDALDWHQKIHAALVVELLYGEIPPFRVSTNNLF